MLQILDAAGNITGIEPELSDSDLQEMYRHMVLTRQFDRRAVALQRQGRIGTYAPSEGQEAVQVGSAYALGPDDWFYPSYRELGAHLTRGMPAEVILTYWRGLPNDPWETAKYQMGILTVPLATQLPHAVGHAYAARLAGEDTVVAGYVGDGATSEGDFHAALTFAGVWKTPNVFVCQNNLYAISVPYSQQTAAASLADKAVGYGIAGVQVDGMDVLAVYQATTEAVHRARRGEGPTLIEAITYRYGPHATADDPTLYRTQAEVDEWRAKDPLTRFRSYLTARDLLSSDLDAQVEAAVTTTVAEAIDRIESQPEPDRGDVVRHAYSRIPVHLAQDVNEAQRIDGHPITEYTAQELWEVDDDPSPPGPTETWNMAESINAALHEAFDHDSRTILLGEDVAKVGGVFRISERLEEQFGAERVIDTPLNESGIVGAAVGMAMAGARPIAEIQFDGFVYPAFDQLVSHVARMRYRTRANATVPMVVRWPNGPGIGAHEFHCDSPETYFVHTPGLVVIVPSTPWDAKGLLASAIESDDPVLFLEPKVLYRTSRDEVPVDRYTIPIGRARTRRDGSDVTVVTYGGMVPTALAVADELALEGVEAEVIDLRTLYPWDAETVLRSVRRTGRLVVVQEPPRTAGIGAEIAAHVGEHALYDLAAPIRRVAGLDTPWPQFAIEHHALISADRIKAAALSTLT